MVSLKQRISIHRMRRSTPPSLAAVDPWRAPGHFRAGETILAADAPGYWPVIVEADDHTDRGLYLPEAGGDYRHQQGCAACAADLGEGTRGIGQQYAEHRQRFTAAALVRADALWNGLRLTEAGDTYRLDPHTPLPVWLHAALTEAVFTGSTVGWPTWGCTDSPVDWPTLMRAYPDVLVPGLHTFCAAWPASWAGIEHAYALLNDSGHQPRLNVSLSVTEDDEISLLPHSLLVTDPELVPTGLVAAIDATLIRHGRPIDLLHYSGGQRRTEWVLAS